MRKKALVYGENTFVIRYNDETDKDIHRIRVNLVGKHYLCIKKDDNFIFSPSRQTEENMTRIFQGHMPGTLTVEGIAQAEALRDTLRDISLDAVVSSDLKRCVDTARIAVEGRNLPWEKMVLLREIDWGSWTGLAIKEVDLRHFPADVETEAMLYERAGRFVDYLKERYDGKQVLAVGHGLINRAVQAHIQGVTLEHLRSVPKDE